MQVVDPPALDALPRLRAQDYPTGVSELNSTLRVEYIHWKGVHNLGLWRTPRKFLIARKRQRADTPRAIVPLAQCAE